MIAKTTFRQIHGSSLERRIKCSLAKSEAIKLTNADKIEGLCFERSVKLM